MRISKQQSIVGVPAIQLRDLLRQTRSPIRPSIAAAALGIEEKDGLKVLTSLVREGYLEKLEGGWYKTELGARLANAKASSPIRRATADRLATELVKRAKEVNEGDYAYDVALLVAFGSYLSEQERVGDLDVAVHLSPKTMDEREFEKLRQERIELQHQRGGFPNFSAHFGWPEEEVYKALKGGNGYISLTVLSEELAWSRGRHQVLYAESPEWESFLADVIKDRANLRVLSTAEAELEEHKRMKKILSEL